MTNTILLGLASAGLLFSGYLSGVKFFTDTCALGESCPYFLGYPACYYGFAMYLTMTVLAILLRRGGTVGHNALRGILFVSALGILFAGYFTLSELPELAARGLGAYLLGLPTCAYGLIVYLAIFGVSAKSLSRKSEGVAETTENVI